MTLEDWRQIVRNQVEATRQERESCVLLLIAEEDSAQVIPFELDFNSSCKEAVKHIVWGIVQASRVLHRFRGVCFLCSGWGSEYDTEVEIPGSRGRPDRDPQRKSIMLFHWMGPDLEFGYEGFRVHAERSNLFLECLEGTGAASWIQSCKAVIPDQLEDGAIEASRRLLDQLLDLKK